MYDFLMGLGYSLIVLLAIMVGGSINRSLARFSPTLIHSSDIDIKPLHKRMTGYTSLEAQEYFSFLEKQTSHKERGDNQLLRYLELFRIDYFFAYAYFLILLLFVYLHTHVLGLHVFFMVLPLFYLVADFLENSSLIAAIDGYRHRNSTEHSDRLLSRHLTTASLATVSKLILILVTLITVLTGLVASALARTCGTCAI